MMCGSDRKGALERAGWVIAAIAFGIAARAVSAQPGTVIVLNKGAASASFFDRDTQQEVALIETGVGPHEVAVSPDGLTAVVADYGDQTPGNTLTVIDVLAKEVVKKIDLGEFARPHGIVYLPDGERVVITAETANSIAVVNITTGEVERSMKTHQAATHMVALSPDAQTAYTANIAPGTVSVVSLAEEGARAKTIATGAGAEGIDVSPDGREVWVTNRAADSVSVIDAASLEVIATMPCGSFPIRAKFTQDGSRVLVSCAMSGEVAVFDAKSREEVARVSMTDAGEDDASGRMFKMGGPVPIGILMAPEGTHAYIACANADALVVVNLEALKTVGMIPTRSQPDGMAFSPVELMPAVIPSRPIGERDAAGDDAGAAAPRD